MDSPLVDKHFHLDRTWIAGMDRLVLLFYYQAESN